MLHSSGHKTVPWGAPVAGVHSCASSKMPLPRKGLDQRQHVDVADLLRSLHQTDVRNLDYSWILCLGGSCPRER